MAKKAAKKAAKIPAGKAAKQPLRDDGEDVSRMEPMRIPEESAARAELNELAFELAQRSASFRSSLPRGLAKPLANYVRSMNCYYSNLIEGHDTNPVDIERALNNDLAADDPKKRNLQLEAKAHIEVQRWIDEGGLQDNELSAAGIQEIHRRFIDLLPDELRWVKHRHRDEQIQIFPGQYRENDAQVGKHIAVSPGAIPRFMARFEGCYAKLATSDAVISAGAAHHRLLFVHPFADGNGRVARLVSYATLRRTLDTGGLWSIARGLARRVKEYKDHLSACDALRLGDRDGRGNLSEAELVKFSRFFLEVCIDQTKFMSDLMEPKQLRDRIMKWAHEEASYDRLPEKAPRIIDAILFRGSLPRSEVASVLGQSERSGRDATNALSRQGIITSIGARGEWQIAFPARLAARITPGLFPD